MTQPKAGTRKYSVPAISVHTSSPRICEMAEAVENKGGNEEKAAETEKNVIIQSVIDNSLEHT
jgi:hypothetical protein